MKGFESAVEAVFGPMGYFPDDILGSLFKQMDTKILPQDMGSLQPSWWRRLRSSLRSSATPHMPSIDEKIIEKFNAAKKAILEKLNMTKPTTAPKKESPMTQHMDEVVRAMSRYLSWPMGCLAGCGGYKPNR